MTRSHALLTQAGAFVPPIFITRGRPPEPHTPEFKAALESIFTRPTIIRFDVPLSRTEWTNLPTIGPTSDIDEALRGIIAGAELTKARGIPFSEVTLVAHHFIAAGASAWSEASSNSERIRIDATWGLPDGLQSFVHDSLHCNLETGFVETDIRYKDKYLDVDANRNTVTRTAYPGLARQHVCSRSTALQISKLTQRVARKVGRTVRIMWFLDVQHGSGGSSVDTMPWIVQEVDQPASAPAIMCSSETQTLRRQADLYRSRRVSNRSSLNRFITNPTSMDIGLRHVLLEPDATAVRDREFLKSFAEAVLNLPNQWRVAYGGSMLSHTPYQLQQLGVAVIPLRQEVRSGRRTHSQKLVRDKIPEKITSHGEKATLTELDPREFKLALREKLIEEALEVAYAVDDDELCEELADLLAVAQAIVDSSGIVNWDAVVQRERQKANKAGRFEKRIYLRSTGPTEESDGPAFDGAKARKTSARSLLVSLTPPMLSAQRSSLLKFAELGLEVIVEYQETEAKISIRSDPRRGTENASAQLALPFGARNTD